MSEVKQLPLSRTSFEVIRQSNMIYVDKTDMIASIVNAPNVGFFLGRPRRFGKTLLVNTFEDLFRNGLKNFQGLKIQTQNLYDDSKTYPVLHIDFSKFKEIKSGQVFIEKFNSELKDFAEKFNIKVKDRYKYPEQIADEIFQSFDIRTLVLLIDEYDAPLNNSMLDAELFEDIRKTYSDFLSTVKSNEGRFRFIFMTGITRYTHASIFSPFNIIEDLTLNPLYQTLLGYTDEELTEYFTPYLEESATKLNMSVEELHSKLKEFYDGYYFNPDLKHNMYCPFSILNFFKYPEYGFKNYWNESGAGTTVVNNYFKKNPISVEQVLKGNKLSASQYSQGNSLSNINYSVLLHQAGYYTFGPQTNRRDYYLTVPNREVSNIIYPLVFENTTHISTENRVEIVRKLYDITQCLFKSDVDTANELFKSSLSFYGYDALTGILSKESELRDTLYILFSITLCDGDTSDLDKFYKVNREEINNKGRLDLSIELNNKEKVVLELKVAKDSHEAQRKLLDAIEQIKTHDYGNNGLISTTNIKRYALVFYKTDDVQKYDVLCQKVD